MELVNTEVKKIPVSATCAACIAKQGGYKNESLLNCISAFSKVWVSKVEKNNHCPNSTSCCRKDKACMNAMASAFAGETTIQQLLNVTGGTAANCSFYEGNRTSSRLAKPWACRRSCKPEAQDANYQCQRYIYECCNPQQIAKGTITYNMSLCLFTADYINIRTADSDSKCTAALPPPPPTASPTSPPPSTPTPPPTPATPPPPAKSVTATIKLSTDMSQIPAGTAARATFEAAFATDMAKLLGNIDMSRIKITSITAGSVIVAFYILPDSAGTPLPATTLTSAFKVTNVPIAGSKTISAATITTTAPSPPPTPKTPPPPAPPAVSTPPAAPTGSNALISSCVVPLLSTCGLWLVM